MPSPVKVAAINSSQLIIELGDGGTPTEVFTAQCMINTSRGIDFSSSPVDTNIPFCPPDENLAGWIDREPEGLTCSVTGAGIFDSVLVPFKVWDTWYNSPISKNLHIVVGALGYYAGAFILSTFRLTGAGKHEKVTFEATMMSDGPVVWHDGP